MNKIAIQDLKLEPFRLLDQQWALLVAGRSNPNPMTVSWGGFGTLWNRPTVTVFVRPTRHTFQCMEESLAFTLNFLPPEMRSALQLCGTMSGRDSDKWKSAAIEPIPSDEIAVPRVAGSILSLECRVMATADLDPKRFADGTIDKLYPEHDYHRVYWGELLAAWSV
jgi:flavin reductase (DIM6/NTAB) family NADH-FMN oxidoreductase RutF